MNHGNIYNAEIVAGSLLVSESRQIARLLLNHSSPEQWHQALVIDNILQKRTTVAAKRQARLIRKRLSLMQPALWEIILHGANDAAAQAIMAAAVKHSRLLGDFMDNVIRRLRQTFTVAVSDKDWREYIEACAQIDPGFERFSPSTRAKLKQVVFRILAESNYLDNTKNRRILPVSVIPEIRRYLVENAENYVLRCMEATL